MNITNPTHAKDEARNQAAFLGALREGANVAGHYLVRAYDTLELQQELDKVRPEWRQAQMLGRVNPLELGVELGIIRHADELLLWQDDIKNTVVNTGLDLYLTNMWKASTYTAQHYVGLTDGTPTVNAADTMASHAGWVEVVAYTQGTRPDLTAGLGTVSGQSLTTSSSRVFSINGTTTAGGAFSTTDSAKSGTAGTLVTAGAFTQGDRSLSNGDTLNVDLTFTAS